MEQTKPVEVAIESCVLLAICMLDLVMTIWLVSTDQASEGNPIMAFYLKRGWNTLIIAKIILVVLPLFVAEWGRRHRPEFVRRVLRFAIVAYIALYALAFVDTDMLASGRITTSDPAVHSMTPQYPTRMPAGESW